jgi:hypothetical protein
MMRFVPQHILLTVKTIAKDLLADVQEPEAKAQQTKPPVKRFKRKPENPA